MRLKKTLQKMSMIGILLTLLFSTIAPLQPIEGTTLVSTLQGKVLHVGGDGPGNYTRIQDAINDSQDGDTVYVYAASSPYHEHLMITKSILLLGENKATTEINGSTLDSSLDTVNITGDHVTVRGFRITLNRGFYYQAAVKVTGTSATIADCTIERNGWIGIYLQGARQCRIADCELADNLVALYLVGSRGNTIANCTCHDNSDAIILFTSSDDNQIINCTCKDNGFDNIHIQQSSGNAIIGCRCENGYDGISLSYAPGTSMRDNTMVNNYANFGIGSPNPSDYDCDIDTSNTINGKPMYYLRDQQDLQLNEAMDIGFLGLVDCENITVKNLEFTHNFEGMAVVGTTHALIDNCSFVNNEGHGMTLIASSETTVRSCVFRNSFFDGVFLYMATDNTLENNSFTGSVNGISLESSPANQIRGQTVSQCSVGVSLDTSPGNTLRENSMDHCGLKLTGHSLADFLNDADTSNTVNDKPLYYVVSDTNLTIPSDAGQVILINCTGCKASDLFLCNASVGIELAYSEGNTLSGNLLNDNSVVGIWLNGGNANTLIRHNTLQGNNYGIDVVASHENILRENTLIGNGLGIAFVSSPINTLLHNLVKDGSYGVYFVDSPLNTMTDTTVDNASVFGVYLLSSNGNVLSANQMRNCSLTVFGDTVAEYINDVDKSNTVNGRPLYYYLTTIGSAVPQDAGEVVLVDCSGCTVSGLSLDRGTTGVLLAYSSNNSITGNTIRRQSLTAVDLSSGQNNDNSIQGNILEGNGYGIDIEYSQGNTVKRNRVDSNDYGILLFHVMKTLVRRNTVVSNLVGMMTTEGPGTILRSNNIYQNYAYGLSVDACTVDARWNWWGTAKGPQGSNLRVVNNGNVTYQPWRFLPVLFAGVWRSSLLNTHRIESLNSQTILSPSYHIDPRDLRMSTSMETGGHHTRWNGEDLFAVGQHQKGVNIK